MTSRDDIIKLAKECGFPFNKYDLLQGDHDGEIDTDEMLEAFFHAAQKLERDTCDAALLRLQSAEIERLTADRKVLQSTGNHPAPCARFCESVAFNIEIRQLKAEIERLNSDRRVLQADGKHPAPCARHCEANAFKVEIRQLKAEIERLRQLEWKIRAEQQTRLDHKDAEIERLKLQLLSASEGTKDREHAEKYFKQAEKLLTSNEQTLHAEIERKDALLLECLEAMQRYQVKRQDFDRFESEITNIKTELGMT